MGERRLCDYCRKHDAATSYERVKGGNKVTEYYCLPCYEQLFVQLNERKDVQGAIACSYCGMTVKQFRARKVVGCSYCYQTLEAETTNMIVKMQGGICGHRGKRPPLSEVDEAIYNGSTFTDVEQREAFRAEMEQRERFLRQKNEMEMLIDFLSDDKERQQEYKDKLDRMERRGIIEEEIVW